MIRNQSRAGCMTETIRTVPATDKFPGLTEIKRGDRTIACVGTGLRYACERIIATFPEKGQ